MKDSSPLSNSTPFPNRLLDEAMPSLKDTEWRLLCVIVRQTLGWRDKTGAYKQQDWLSHTQLKQRTRRASAAISAGIDSLVRRNLIEVRNESGDPLLTPQDRRRERGRLLFRLHPHLLHHNMSTNSGSETPLLQSELQKGKSTKENNTKFSKILLSISESEMGSALCTRPNTEGKQPLPSTINKSTGTSVTTAFIKLYTELYRQHKQDEPPDIAPEIHQLLIKRLDKYGLEELEHLLPIFFANEYSYALRKNYSLESYLELISIIRTKQVGLKSKQLVG